MTAERFALDTNVLVYARDDLEPERQARARIVLERSVQCGRCVLSAQTVGELHAALRKRGLVPPTASTQAVRDMVALFPLMGIQPQDTAHALDAVATGRFSYWDALMIATVARAGCSTLLSEDMQDGDVLAGVTIRNPFAGAELPVEVEALLG